MDVTAASVECESNKSLQCPHRLAKNSKGYFGEEDCYEPKHSSKLDIFKKIVMKNDRRKQKLSMSQQGFPFKIRDNRGKRVREVEGGRTKPMGKGKQAESGDFLPF